MYYNVSDKLKVTTFENCQQSRNPFVAVIKPAEWQSLQDALQMGIDMDFDFASAKSTKAEVNLDSLTGTFKIPNRDDLLNESIDFSFALDERGIVFIDQHHHVEHLVKKIQKSKKWKNPSLERFLYDFLETIIKGDSELLEAYDKYLDNLEETILDGKNQYHESDLNSLRRKLTKLNLHYSQLLDLSQELAENENNFFQEENLRFFHLFSARVARLQSTVLMLRETIIQIREMAKSQLEMRQNKNMAILTTVTTCCMPLTILVGWYGMNFKYMPELASPLGYPLVIIFAVTIFIAAILYSKFKKWL
ncbi:magnesium transporter CorA family protein [Streptococcus porcinus]|uniref:CorA-like3 Mg2+ transporter protein n=2 Tax=Streptococcus porcinus TaxID=1340 RepID=A0A4V0H581_STRPO|nr:CorA family divalent cation transporter [Streptococcus porcinus]EGJ27618.1 putative magnesium and cobalt transport protein CorA [Streptococcus porcinus str. Jelinkova 176]MBA2796004.1 magnesium transporter CorA [Streptococcus porcinus]SQG43676.1 CorA-like3 Mg2+ transporter protein [Streptococcus porcinus]VTT42757.1 CorA-like3 Mg2+ transporter protein [Streptococcus porcinus]VTT44371.1 CorA-like3 Mg2+ transporter protein [Streptococcus porcinus]